MMTNAFAKSVGAIRRGESNADDAARALLGQLSVRERLGLLDGDQSFWLGVLEMALRGYNTRPIVAGAVPRLGIPGIRFTDGPRGIVMGHSTCFPVAMARGATWDVALEEEIGRVIGAEGRAQGANLFAGVCVNLLRHPAWGRAQETYGEDPLLLGAMGAALARGVRTHLMACVKHYALNSIENARFVVDVRVDEDVLHEVYLPHFRHIVASGVEGVMSAYNAVNGEWCGESRTLLTDILRDEWGFAGFVMSDFLFGLRDASGSLRAGLDLEMPFLQQRAERLPAALAEGRVGHDDVERACVRLLGAQLAYAARLESPEPDRRLVAAPSHRLLARRAAAQAIVLLRNEALDGAPLLPLRRSDVERVAVVGGLARHSNLGDKGSSAVRPPYAVSILAGLQSLLGHAAVRFERGRDVRRAAAIAAEADVAVVVVGYRPHDEGEGVVAAVDDVVSAFPWPLGRPPLSKWLGRALNTIAQLRIVPGGDRRRLSLSPRDEKLIAAVSAANARTVVIVIGGSAVVMERWRTSVPAILLGWYPGMEGGAAIAEVLFGAAEPGGRLPFAMVSSEAHLPHFDATARSIVYDRWWGQRWLDRQGVAAAYPLGFGLGYTKFSIRDAAIARGSVEADDLMVSVSVRNDGDRPGGTVVQAYWEAMGGGADAPLRQLAGFARVSGEPGEEVVAELAATARAISTRDAATKHWSLPPGPYRLTVGQFCGDANGKVLVVGA